MGSKVCVRLINRNSNPTLVHGRCDLYRKKVYIEIHGTAINVTKNPRKRNIVQPVTHLILGDSPIIDINIAEIESSTPISKAIKSIATKGSIIRLFNLSDDKTI